MMKICRKCKKEKPIDDFYKHKEMTDGYLNICKECILKRAKIYGNTNRENIREYNKRWRETNKEREAIKAKNYRIKNADEIKENKKIEYIKNKEKYLKRGRIYYYNNKEKIKEGNKLYYRENTEKISERNKIWYNNNREKYNNYLVNKRKTDLRFNLNCRMKSTICESLKGNKKGHHWETLVGYTLDDLLKRLKETMPDGYTWQDYLKGKLHIDHIIPISAFNYTKPEHLDFGRCWALENLQLLPAKENLVKGSKLTKSFQLALQV